MILWLAPLFRDRLIRSVEDGWVEWLASEGEDDECIVGGIGSFIVVQAGSKAADTTRG